MAIHSFIHSFLSNYFILVRGMMNPGTLDARREPGKAASPPQGTIYMFSRGEKKPKNSQETHMDAERTCESPHRE